MLFWRVKASVPSFIMAKAKEEINAARRARPINVRDNLDDGVCGAKRNSEALGRGGIGRDRVSSSLAAAASAGTRAGEAAKALRGGAGWRREVVRAVEI